MLEKLKSFYQRWKDNRISTSKQHQFINVKSTSKFDVETTLILRWLWKQLCSYFMVLEKLKSLYQGWKDNRISTSKQRQLFNVKLTSKFDVETTLILRWLWKQLCSYFMVLEKLKSLYQGWKDNRISTSKQRQLFNVKLTSKFDVETTLILRWLWKQFCSYFMMLEKLNSL